MMIWIVRILLAVCLLAFLLVGAILVVEPEIRLGSQRAMISAALTRLAGREIHLGDTIDLSLGRHARLAVTDVQIANPPWATTPVLFSGQEIRVGIDLFALLSGTVHLEGLKLHNVATNLEVGENSETSWSFSQPNTRRETSASSNGWRWIIGDALLETVALTYRDHGSASSSPVALNLTRFRQYNDRGMLVLDGLASVNGLETQLSGNIGTLDALLRRRDVDVDLNLALNETVMTVRGHFGSPTLLEDIELQAAIRGPNTADLATILGITRPIPGDLDLKVRVSDLEHGFGWSADGHAGSLKLDARGTIEDPLTLDHLQFDVDIQGADFAALGNWFGIKPLPAHPYRLAGSLVRDASRIELRDIRIGVGDSHMTLSATLPAFPTVDGGSTSFDLSVENAAWLAELLQPGMVVNGPFQVKGTLESLDNGDESIDITAQWQGNQLTLSGPIGAHPGYRNSTVNFVLTGPEARNLLDLAGLEDLEGPHAMAYRLAGNIAVDTEDRVQLSLAEGHIGQTRIQAEGRLGRLPGLHDLDLAVNLKGESLHGALQALADQPLADHAFAIAFRMSGDPRAPVLSTLRADLGNAVLKTRGRIGLVPLFHDTNATFELELPPLAQLLPEHANRPWAKHRYQASGKLSKTGKPLLFQNVKIEGAPLDLALDASIDESFRLAGSSLRLSAKASDLAAVLPAIAAFEPPSAPLSLEAELIGDSRSINLQRLNITLDDAELTGKGRLALQDASRGAGIDFSLDVPRLSSLGIIAGRPLPDQPLKLDAKLTRANQNYALRNTTALVGGGRITADLTLTVADRPRLAIDADMQAVDFSTLVAPPRQAASGIAHPATDPAQPPEMQERLIPASPLPFTALNAIDADVKLRGTGLNHPDPKFLGKTLVSDLDLGLTLENGQLTIEQLHLVGDHGTLGLAGTLNARADPATIQGVLQASQFRLGMLAPDVGLENLPAHEINIQLSAAGNTLNSLAASATGSIRSAGGPGITTNRGLDSQLDAFTYRLLQRINPWTTREAHTPIECSALAATFDAGIVQLVPGITLRTNNVDISASGTINLKTEAIDIQFRNVPRRGIGISTAGLVSPYVAVGGTLTRPQLVLDGSGTLVAGTAAVATAGVSVLITSLLDRAGTAVNPCEQLIAAADANREVPTINPLDSLSNAMRRRLRGSSSRGGEAQITE
jgi:uncharacterized protein involved in outer membrane biogenesis